MSLAVGHLDLDPMQYMFPLVQANQTPNRISIGSAVFIGLTNVSLYVEQKVPLRPTASYAVLRYV